MVSRRMKLVISGLGSSCRSLYSECSVAFRLPVSVCSYTWMGSDAMVSAITRTQAYTVDIWIAVEAVTDLPDTLEPKEKDGAELTAFCGLGLSLARAKRANGFFIATSVTGQSLSCSRDGACTGAASFPDPKTASCRRDGE